MAIAFVSAWTGKQNSNNSGGSTAGKAVTAGNFLVICTSGSTTTVTTTTSVSDTILQANPATFGTSPADMIRCQYVESAVGGAAVTVTVAHAAGNFTAICAAEYSGMATSSSLDQHSVAGTGNSGTLLSASVTTTQNDELLIGHGTIVAAVDTAWTAGASMTIRSQTNLDSVGACTFVEDRILTATGSYTAGATKGAGSGQWIMGIASFKAAAGGAATSDVRARSRTLVGLKIR